jgi:hypothetical protein
MKLDKKKTGCGKLSFAFSANFSDSSNFVRSGLHLSSYEMNLCRNATSSVVNLFPFCEATTRLGGVGDRDGGSGTLSSACGGVKLRTFCNGAYAVRLLIVARFVDFKIGSEGFGWRRLLSDRPRCLWGA